MSPPPAPSAAAAQPPQPRPTALLNFDVLADVLACMATGAELLPAMRACRTLYLAGVPLLLRAGVVVRTRAKLVSFCRFALRDGPARFRHLRSLEVAVPGRFRNAAKAELLVRMFASARYLERLEVYDCEVLLSDARLPAVLAQLAVLRKVTLHSLNDAAHAFLDRLDAGLGSVDICFYGDTVEGPGDPVPLLARFAPCLRELRVTYAEFGHGTVCYVNLTTLVVDDCQFAKVAPLVSCFPNLRDLSLWMGHEDDELDEEEIEEHRQLNGDAQAHARWNGLENLRGSILSLYMLQLKCNVTHLDVQSAYLTTDSAYQLAGILTDVSPLILTVRIDVARFDIRRLGELFRAKNVAGLIIHLDFWERTVQPAFIMVRAAYCLLLCSPLLTLQRDSGASLSRSVVYRPARSFCTHSMCRLWCRILMVMGCLFPLAHRPRSAQRNRRQRASPCWHR